MTTKVEKQYERRWQFSLRGLVLLSIVAPPALAAMGISISRLATAMRQRTEATVILTVTPRIIIHGEEDELLLGMFDVFDEVSVEGPLRSPSR